MPEYEITIKVNDGGQTVVTVDVRCLDLQRAIALLDQIRSVQPTVVLEG